MSFAFQPEAPPRFNAETRPRIWAAHRADATFDFAPGQEATAVRQFAHACPFYVIYGPDNLDRPGRYLARLFFGRPKVEPTNYVLEAIDLARLRARLPGGLHQAPRAAGDDAAVVELYL